MEARLRCGIAAPERRLAGGYAVDAQQSDGIAGRGGISGGEFVRARVFGESRGGGAYCRDGCARRAGWAHRAAEESGDAGRRAARHPRRPHDRERVLHLFRCSGDGFMVASRFLFCAGSGYGFSARAGRAHRLPWRGLAILR